MSTASKLVRLDSVVAIVGGGTPSKANPSYFNGLIPWVTPKDMRNGFITDTEDHISQEALENSSSRLVPQNSVLVVVRSGVLKHTLPVALNAVPVAINQDMKALICSSDVHPPYLAYALRFKSKKLLQRVRGTTADNIPLDELRALSIPVPPIPEQKRIAAILGKADAIRHKRKHAVRLADEFLRSLFLDMFGDPAKNPNKLPIVRIGDIITSATYGTSKKAHDTGRYPVLRMLNITYTGGWNFSDLKFIDLDEREVERYLARKGDILFNRTNSRDLVGKTGVFRSDVPMAYAGYLIRLRANDRAHPEYISAFLNSNYMKRVLRDKCKDIIGMANINARELQAFPVPLPPFSAQAAFAAVVERIIQSRSLLERGTCDNEMLNRALSHCAFSGEFAHTNI